MNFRKEVNVLLDHLAKSLSLAELSLDDNNHCMLLFDDKVVLNMEFNEDRGILVVYSYIGEVPFEGRENIFETLLESNCFWQETEGATIGIDKHTQTVVLAYPFELPVSSTKLFEERLAIFVDTTESWMERLDKMAKEAEVLANEDR